MRLDVTCIRSTSMFTNFSLEPQQLSSLYLLPTPKTIGDGTGTSRSVPLSSWRFIAFPCLVIRVWPYDQTR